MPKGSRHTIVKGAASSRGKKSRKKRQTTRYPAPPALKQISQQTSDKKEASLARFTANIQQVPSQPHVLPDLKRIGMISGAMIVILVILYLAL